MKTLHSTSHLNAKMIWYFGSDSPGLLVEAATAHSNGMQAAATVHANGIKEGMERIREGMQSFAISLFCSALVLGVSYISVAIFASKK
jgi:hypothetical protein